MYKKFSCTLALSAIVLFGMAACGNKAENNQLPEQTDMVELEETTPETTDATILAAMDSLTKEEGVVPDTTLSTTASGLKYRVIKEGTGKSPSATDVVEVNYEGRLMNGKIFDSSYSRGVPAVFPLNQVIPGWTEGLQLMKEGGVYEFYLPYNLAYGERGAGDDIPPYSNLLFKVELIKVQ